MKKSIAVLLILAAALQSKAIEITSQDIETVITEQVETHSALLVNLSTVETN